MALLYNKTSLKEKRRSLRRNQTEAEGALWGKLRNRRFLGLKFFRQYGVGPYVVDFYCPAYKLAIELDGGQHTEEEGAEHDEVRTGYLKSVGIEVMRFWNHDVLQRMDGVLERIEGWVRTPPGPLFGKEGERQEWRGSEQSKESLVSPFI